MLETVRGDTSMLRLEALLQGRYGKGLVLRQIVDAEKIRQIDCWGGEFALIEGDLHIPLRMNDNVLGTAVIPKATDLSIRSQGDIAELVKLVLEPQLYNKHLETKFVNLEQMLKNETHLAEVLNGQNFFNESSFEIIETEENHDRQELLTSFVHLSSRNSELQLKAANVIHEITGNWAFLPFADVADQIHEINDLMDMGSVTLFIKDIEALTRPQQILVEEYIKLKELKERPLILVGSSLSTESILASQKIPEGLKQGLLACNLDVERLPMTHQRLKEVLELMLIRSF